MTVRGSFRGAVEGPRPYGALVMVAAACATLDITGQLAAWAVLIQAFSLGWAALRIESSWQRQPALLNSALVASVAVGSGLWLRGAPATVALAYFATLAQCLQLLDARPRTSEFLLVALALFQVILASNLTDSVLFPPLLVVFLLATVWTLLVHTLQVEALESGDALASRRIATPGLLRTTLVASSLSILLALALFLVLPRMRGAVMRGGGAFGASVPISGFSDQVTLGDLGRIRSDPRAVLHVETLAPPDSAADPAAAEAGGYWRGLALDHFDGTRWSVTPSERARVPGDPELGLGLAPLANGEPEWVQRIVREPVAAGVVFTRGTPRYLRGVLMRLERDYNGGLYAASQAEQRVIYTVTTSPPVTRVAPEAAAQLPLYDGERFLQLPETAAWVGELAARISAGAAGDGERAQRIEQWLRTHGRYTDTPPDIGDAAPVEAFLGQGLAGHCEYFASAMVVLLRTLGIPARLVNGFAGGRTNRIGGFVTLTRADAHAWVEAHFADVGWVRFDPTPPDLRLAAAGAARGPRIAELFSALEIWWFQQVVDFDRSDQARAARSVWLGWRRWRSTRQPAAVPAADSGRRSQPLVDGRAIVLAAGIIALLLLASRLRGRRRDGPRVPREYRTALRLLARRGLVRDPATPPRAFARQVADALPAAAAAFDALTEGYLLVRFGGRACAAGGAPDEALQRLRDSLRG